MASFVPSLATIAVDDRQFQFWGITIILVLICPFVYFPQPLREIPQARVNSRKRWPKSLFHEPRAPELFEYHSNTPNNGLLRYSGLFGEQRVLIIAVKGLHEVLQEKSYSFRKAPLVKNLLGPLLGDGLLLAEGDVHKIQRKKLGPAFAPRHIKDLQVVFWRKAGELTDALSATIDRSKAGSQSSVNFSIWAARVALDIISVAAFDGDLGTLQKPKTDVASAYSRLFGPRRESGWRTLLGAILPRSILQAVPLQRNKEIAEANDSIRHFCQKSIERAKDRLATREGKETDIISVALRSEQFDDEDLMNQVMTFLVAGHETTAQTLSWAIYFLYEHPTVQSRLRSEIRNHLPPLLNGHDQFLPGQLDELPYLHAVCNETLRLMPALPVVYRQAAEPTTILNHFIPAGTMIAISPWIINRSFQIWGADAEMFNPDRWLGNLPKAAAAKGGADGKDKYNMLTFLHGPRSCIGQTFARAELPVLLASLVGRFEFEAPSEEGTVQANFNVVTVKPKGGLKVRLRRLEGW